MTTRGDGTARSAVLAAANDYGKRCIPRTCQHVVRTWLGAPGGAPTAAASWYGAKYKHRGDASPPPGVPVYWAPNHVALHLGNGAIMSTDWPTTGKIGLTSIQNLTSTWNLRYLGWVEDINGMRIRGIVNESDASNSGGIGIPNIPGLPDFAQPGSVFGTVTGTAGDVLGTAGDVVSSLPSPLQPLLSLANFVKWIADWHNIQRIFMAIGGAFLLLFALYRFDVVKKAAKNVAQKAVKAKKVAGKVQADAS